MRLGATEPAPQRGASPFNPPSPSPPAPRPNPPPASTPWDVGGVLGRSPNVYPLLRNIFCIAPFSLQLSGYYAFHDRISWVARPAPPYSISARARARELRRVHSGRVLRAALLNARYSKGVDIFGSPARRSRCRFCKKLAAASFLRISTTGGARMGRTQWVEFGPNLGIARQGGACGKTLRDSRR